MKASAKAQSRGNPRVGDYFRTKRILRGRGRGGVGGCLWGLGGGWGGDLRLIWGEDLRATTFSSAPPPPYRRPSLFLQQSSWIRLVQSNKRSCQFPGNPRTIKRKKGLSISISMKLIIN